MEQVRAQRLKKLQDLLWQARHASPDQAASITAFLAELRNAPEPLTPTTKAVFIPSRRHAAARAEEKTISAGDPVRTPRRRPLPIDANAIIAEDEGASQLADALEGP